nr:TniQ family protein [Microvirga mediterraneensis]
MHPTVRLMPGETPASFVSRLACRNWRPSMRVFCSEMAVPFQGIVDGSPTALGRIAELVGIPSENLLKGAIMREGKAYRAGQEAVLTRLSLRRERVMGCASCLSKDIASSDLPREAAPYGRMIWNLTHIRRCPVHGTPLVELARAKRNNFNHDFARLIEPVIDQIEHMAAASVPASPSRLETYLLERLDGRTSSSRWLDKLPFYAAARTCEMLGAVAVFGRRQNLNHLGDADWIRAGDVGFGIASAGEAAIDVFLTELRVSHQDGWLAANGPQAWFGRVYQWLAFGTSDPAYDELRDIFTRNLVDNTPLGPGNELFGKPVRQRKVHSLRTAFLETGVHPSRLRKILTKTGHLKADQLGKSDHEVVFDAVATADLLRRLSDALTHVELMPYLNANRVQVDILIREGFLRPIVEGTDEEVGWRCYAREDADQFLQTLTAEARDVDAAPEGTFSIPDAAKRANCHSTEIVDLIRQRRLAWVGRLGAVHGYNSILVEDREIRERVRGPELEGYTLNQTYKRLRINSHAVNALIDKGVLKTVVQRHPASRTPLRIVPFAEFKWFQAQYVTLFEAARILGLHPMALKKALVASGVRPVFDPAEMRVTFYEREHVRKVSSRLFPKGTRSE